MKISEKHYLGPLCKRNHDYNNSGKSLRHKKYRYCLKCSKNWKKDNPKKNKKTNSEYRKKNIKKINNYLKTYSPIYKKDYRSELKDGYVKDLLMNIGITKEDITDNLIILKKEQIQAHRLITQIKREINYGTT